MGALKADKGNGLDYLYHQRNDRDTFIRYGEYMQSGDAEVCFTENEANTSLLPSREVEYSDEEEAPAPVNKDIYEFDSDEGNTSFFLPKRSPSKSPKVPRARQASEVRERRTTLPSHSMLVPTENSWKWCVCCEMSVVFVVK